MKKEDVLAAKAGHPLSGEGVEDILPWMPPISGIVSCAGLFYPFSPVWFERRGYTGRARWK